MRAFMKWAGAGLMLAVAFPAQGSSTQALSLWEQRCRACHTQQTTPRARHNHPIDIPYATAPGVSGLRARPVLPLPEGRLGCVSCHLPVAQGAPVPHGGLRVARAHLCAQCHEL